MTLLPLIDCSKMLTVDPKTLRSWLLQAKMAVSLHPNDARVKCLTEEQVQHLAVLYGRVLTSQFHRPIKEREPFSPHDPAFQVSSERAGEATSVTLPDGPDADTAFSLLQKQVAILQEQLAGLTLLLLQERSARNEHRLQHLEALLLPSKQPVLFSPDLSRGELLQPEEGGRNARPLHPAELHMRARVVPPLVEYGAASTYVIICPLQGELPFLLDSPEWFDWLARLSSFRFVGKQGSFTAYRKGTLRKPSRTWLAQRYFHQHTYRHYLGLTEHLTMAQLEQVAARLQSNMR
jgi:hypothetical protein